LGQRVGLRDGGLELLGDSLAIRPFGGWIAHWSGVTAGCSAERMVSIASTTSPAEAT
jgi:ribulose 1,5-bisphosphate carboxylase large subunit-like protein